MLRLKLATEQDASSVLAIAEELHQNSVYSSYTPLDRDRVVELFLKSLQLAPDRQVTLLLLSDEDVVGLLAVGLTEMLYSSDPIATEIAFWITPSHRNYRSLKIMLDAYHYWAKKVGCKALLIGKIKDSTKPEEYKLRILK